MRGSRRLDWEVGWWSETIAVATGGSTLISLLTGEQLEGFEDDVTVERIIGQYYIGNTDTNPALFHARIGVRQVAQGGTVPINLNLVEDADEPFMWHRTHVIEPSSSTMGSLAHPWWSTLDIKVNRRLGDQDELLMTIQRFAGDDPFSWAAWVRVLCKH